MLPADARELIDAPLEAVPVGFDELMLLWRGDDDSFGFQHAEIVAAVCELQRPYSAAAAVAIFYPGVALADVAEAEVLMIERGYELWQDRLKLPAPRRRSGVQARVDKALGR